MKITKTEGPGVEGDLNVHRTVTEVEGLTLWVCVLFLWLASLFLAWTLGNEHGSAIKPDLWSPEPVTTTTVDR